MPSPLAKSDCLTFERLFNQNMLSVMICCNSSEKFISALLPAPFVFSSMFYNDVMRHRIDELRKEAGMTQDTYGREILHCSQGTASQKLSGQLALSALDIFRSATAFNVSTDYLYGTCIGHLKLSPWTNCSSHPGGG